MLLFHRLTVLALTSHLLACAPSTPRAVDSTQAPAAKSEGPIQTYPDAGPGPSPWDDARRRGVDFRAIGQEPGWVLEIDREKQMYLLADYGEKKVYTPIPAPRDSAGTTIYDATTEAHRLTVALRAAVCHDSMSGEEMTHTVTVTLDGKEYRGCGRQLGG